MRHRERGHEAVLILAEAEAGVREEGRVEPGSGSVTAEVEQGLLKELDRTRLVGEAVEAQIVAVGVLVLSVVGGHVRVGGVEAVLRVVGHVGPEVVAVQVVRVVEGGRVLDQLLREQPVPEAVTEAPPPRQNLIPSRGCCGRMRRPRLSPHQVEDRAARAEQDDEALELDSAERVEPIAPELGTF